MSRDSESGYSPSQIVSAGAAFALQQRFLEGVPITPELISNTLSQEEQLMVEHHPGVATEFPVSPAGVWAAAATTGDIPFLQTLGTPVLAMLAGERDQDGIDPGRQDVLNQQIDYITTQLQGWGG